MVVLLWDVWCTWIIPTHSCKHCQVPSPKPFQWLDHQRAPKILRAKKVNPIIWMLEEYIRKCFKPRLCPRDARLWACWDRRGSDRIVCDTHAKRHTDAEELLDIIAKVQRIGKFAQVNGSGRESPVTWGIEPSKLECSDQIQWAFGCTVRWHYQNDKGGEQALEDCDLLSNEPDDLSI